MQSGHIVAQKAQPMQLSSLTASTGLCPFLLILLGESSNTFLGQTPTQRPQPLQLSTLIVSFAIIFSLIKSFFEALADKDLKFYFLAPRKAIALRWCI